MSHSWHVCSPESSPAATSTSATTWGRSAIGSTDQGSHDAFYCVVDLHALTLDIDPAELRARTHDTALDLLAAGLDPERCTLFVQSHVVQHAQMAWLLECTATMGELQRMTQFKDKSGGKESVRVGLFTYPVLMAADIVLYDAERVPVGDDQRQHLELARDVAIRFNRRFGDTLVVPEAAIPAAGARVMDLQHPERKMSKSLNSPLGTVLFLDDPAEITRKIKKAVTDTDGEVRYDPEQKPGLANLLELLAAATGPHADGGGRQVRPLRRPEGRHRRGPGRAAAPAAGPPGGAGRRPRCGARAAGPGRRQGDRGGWPPPTTGRRRRSACSDRHERRAAGRAHGRHRRRRHPRHPRPGDRTSAEAPTDRAAVGRVRWFLTLSLRPVLLYLASRAGMLLVASATASDTHQPLSQSLTVWDSFWYLSIASGGYVHHIPPGHGNPAQSNLGFFPLIPVLTWITHEVTRFGVSVSGLLTTFVLGLAAAVAVWWMLRDVFGQKGADRGTALVFFSPGALVLSLVYTEAATILMVACALMALRRQRWVVAGLCAAVATTADPVGIAVVVPCVVAAVLAIRDRREWRALWAPALAPARRGVVLRSTCGPTPARRSSTSRRSAPGGRAARTSTGSPARSTTSSSTGSPTRTTPSRGCRPSWPSAC